MGGCQACPAFALANDGPAARFDLDACPHGVAIGANSLQAETDPVMGRRGVVAEQGRRAVLVIDDQVDVAVVVEVAVGQPPPDVVGVEVRSCFARRELEP